MSIVKGLNQSLILIWAIAVRIFLEESLLTRAMLEKCSICDFGALSQCHG